MQRSQIVKAGRGSAVRGQIVAVMGVGAQHADGGLKRAMDELFEVLNFKQFN
jgi:hypothetical protein